MAAPVALMPPSWAPLKMTLGVGDRNLYFDLKVLTQAPKGLITNPKVYHSATEANGLKSSFSHEIHALKVCAH